MLLDAYIRVSHTGDRSEEESTEMYEAMIRDWADRSGATIGVVVTDTDVSGAAPVAERGLERLIQRAEAGESEGIVTPFLDRFGRDSIQGAIALKRITDAGGKLVAVRDGFDSTDEGSKLNFNLRMAIAQDFLDRNAKNWEAVYARAERRGMYLTRKPPFGYRKDEEKRLVVVEAEAEIVRELFARRARNENSGVLRRWFRERCASLPEVDGGPHPGTRMTTNGLKKLLRNRAYLGEAKFPTRVKGQPKVVKGNHPPILTEAQWEAAQVKFAFTGRTGLSAEAHLRGLVYCSGCGRRLKVHGYAKPGKPRSANYACTSENCPARVSMKAAWLDAYVEGAIQDAALAGEPHVVAVIEGDTRYADAMGAVEQARRDYEEFRDSIEIQRELGVADFAAGLKTRKAALAVARQELGKVPPPHEDGAQSKSDGSGGASAAEVEDALAAQNVARFVSRVVVGPSGQGRVLTPAERATIYLVGSDAPYEPELVAA